MPPALGPAGSALSSRCTELAVLAPQVLPSTSSPVCPLCPKLCSWHRASAAHCIYCNCLIPTLLVSVQLNPTNHHHETEHIKALAIERCCTALNAILKGSCICTSPLEILSSHLHSTSPPKAFQTFDVHVLEHSSAEQAWLWAAALQEQAHGYTCVQHQQDETRTVSCRHSYGSINGNIMKLHLCITTLVVWGGPISPELPIQSRTGLSSIPTIKLFCQ